ncbi:MAG: hypothetical protein R2777_01360 [Chitinophagales bacterium]
MDGISIAWSIAEYAQSSKYKAKNFICYTLP